MLSWRCCICFKDRGSNYELWYGSIFLETISYNYTTLWIILQQCSFRSRRKKLNNNRHTVMEATQGPFLTAEAQWFPKSKFYIHCSHSRNSPSTPQSRQIPIFESWSIGYLGGSCWHAGIPDLSLSMHPGYCMIAPMTLGGQSKVSKGRKSCFSVGLAGMACRIHSGHLYLGLIEYIELVAICMGASHGWFGRSVQVNRAWLRCWRCVQNTSRILSGWQVEGHSGKGRWFWWLSSPNSWKSQDWQEKVHYSSSHHHGSGKWVAPRLVCLKLG